MGLLKSTISMCSSVSEICITTPNQQSILPYFDKLKITMQSLQIQLLFDDICHCKDLTEWYMLEESVSKLQNLLKTEILST